MRLSKREKQVDQLIADGHDYKTIAALLKIQPSELFSVFSSIKAKYQENALKEARIKDIVMRNELLAPRIRGLKCQNLDKENPKYWFYTGFESDVLIAHELFTGLGITATIRENGEKGKFWLIVDSWVTGELLPITYQELTSKHLGSEGEKENVNNSFGETTDTTANCFETGFEYLGEFQSQDIECFA